MKNKLSRQSRPNNKWIIFLQSHKPMQKRSRTSLWPLTSLYPPTMCSLVFLNQKRRRKRRRELARAMTTTATQSVPCSITRMIPWSPRSARMTSMASTLNPNRRGCIGLTEWGASVSSKIVTSDRVGHPEARRSNRLSRKKMNTDLIFHA